MRTIYRLFFSVLFLILPGTANIQAQPRITDTPASVVLPTSEGVVLPAGTPLAATMTFTPAGPDVFLEANTSLDQIDVRDFPETGAYLGSLEAGRQYRILGQYYSWLFFEYPAGPGGRAWIYRPIIRIIGDPEAIPIVDPAQVNISSADAAATGTQSALEQTPGYFDTATASARQIVITPEVPAESINELLPTYTPPADIVSLSADSEVLAQGGVNFATGIPPIIPIGLLIIGGLLGLLVQKIRK